MVHLEQLVAGTSQVYQWFTAGLEIVRPARPGTAVFKTGPSRVSRVHSIGHIRLPTIDWYLLKEYRFGGEDQFQMYIKQVSRTEKEEYPPSHTGHLTRYRSPLSHHCYRYQTRHLIPAILLATGILSAIIAMDIIPAFSYPPSPPLPVSSQPSLLSISYPPSHTRHLTRYRSPLIHQCYRYHSHLLLPVILHATGLLSAIIAIDIIPAVSFPPSHSLPVSSEPSLLSISYPPSHSRHLTRYRSPLSHHCHRYHNGLLLHATGLLSVIIAIDIITAFSSSLPVSSQPSSLSISYPPSHSGDGVGRALQQADAGHEGDGVVRAL